MTRQLITVTTLVALCVANFVGPVQACGTKSRRSSSYSRSYSRPVRVVQPVTVVKRTVVTPAPAVEVEKELPTVPAGAMLTLPANFLGNEPGSVLMVFNKIKLPVQVRQWTMTGVVVQLPPMAIKDAVVVRLDIVLPNGQLGLSQEVRVTAPAPVIMHPGQPTPQLPTQAALAQSNVASTVQRPQVQVLSAGPSATQVRQSGTPGSPIVLPSANVAERTLPASTPAANGAKLGTPGNPIVLPTVGGTQPAAQATATTGNAPAATTTGRGTPDDPIVLPSTSGSAPAASAAQSAPIETNPILLEAAGSQATMPAAELSGETSELEGNNLPAVVPAEAPAESPAMDSTEPQEDAQSNIPTGQIVSGLLGAMVRVLAN